MYQNTLCIVLHTSNYRDYDKMLTLFSRETGRIDALARGCRKQGASLLAVCEPFVCADFQLYAKGAHISITGAVMKESFYGLRSDVAALYTASVLSNVCSHCVMPQAPEPQLFGLLANCLYALASRRDPASVFVFFTLRLSEILGVAAPDQLPPPLCKACAIIQGLPAIELNRREIMLGDAFSSAATLMCQLLDCEVQGLPMLKTILK